MSFCSIALCLTAIFCCWATQASAEGFVCAGSQGSEAAPLPEGVAAKPARIAATTGTRRALVLFARFKGEPANPVPSWAGDIFNSDLPGSFSHFYDTMSFGKLQVRGEVAPRVYESAKSASAYLSVNSSEQGQFGVFSQEILRQADQDIDFSQYDNDGPDGVPNSGDDDGVVDAVFLVLEAVPVDFLKGEATGIVDFGFSGVFSSHDIGAKGKAVLVFPGQGTIQQGRSFSEAMGSMCHEYGHVLGLPDLYDTEFLKKQGAPPEEDAAGVGAWCLMGWGASGWNGNDGPNSFCAWSRLQLGWAEVVEVSQPREEMRLSEVGSTGEVYKVPVAAGEYILLEYRQRTSTYYDRHIPGEGVLIWHVASLEGLVDLECADGRWKEAGYPQGKTPDAPGGSDNLDFWAHDAAYRQAHHGNLGDTTDPFDGKQFRDFTPESNPSTHSLDGTRSVQIAEIHFESGKAVAQVQTDPVRMEVESLFMGDEDNNGILSLGETATLRFRLDNRGGLTAPEIRTVLSAADPLVHIDHRETRFGAVEIGRHSLPLQGERFPQVSLIGDPEGNRQVPLTLEVFSGETKLARSEYRLKVASTFRWSGQVEDEAGNAVTGLPLTIFDGSGTNHLVTTASDGAFQEDLLPGTYTVYIMPTPPRSSLLQGIELYTDVHSELVLANTYPVFGTVRDPQGQPMSGVMLFAIAQRYGGRIYQAATVSAQDGTYTLDLVSGPNNITIRGVPEGLPDQGLTAWVDGPKTLDINLRKGVRLSTQITDEQGEGLALSLRARRLPLDLRLPFASQTDAKGQGAVDLVPGVYLVEVLSSPPAVYNRSGFMLPVFSDTTVQFHLRKGNAVSGRVEDESTELYPNTSLLFVPQAPYNQNQGVVQVADDGTYGAQLPPSPSQVIFQGDGGGRTLRQRVGEIPAEGVQIFDVKVRPGERVEGKVVGEGGQVLGGLKLQALSVGAGVTSTVPTQADGSFRFYLPPGAYQFTGIEDKGAFFPLGNVEVPFADTLELKRHGVSVLQGRVVDGQGHPVEQALVVLTQDLRLLTNVQDATWFPLLYQSGGLVSAVLSGEKGAYQLRAQSGTYDLVILPVNGIGVGRVLRNVELSGDRTQDLVLSVPEEVYQVFGQIIEEADMPGGEIVLQFLDEKTGVAAQFTDSGYRGYGAELPPGHYQVRAGRLGPVGGFQKAYEAGAVSINNDIRWDINLADAVTAVTEEPVTTPQTFFLAPNYPNPFNPTTTIRFSLPQPGEAELAIYNLLGQRVATLVRGVQEAGPQVLQWNGRDDSGRELASGVYFYRLQAGAQVETCKLLLLR